MAVNVEIMVMSGVDDGLVLGLDPDTDGKSDDREWILTIGRREDCDVCLRNDTYISRDHARLRRRDDGWWLEDRDSKNGTFVEAGDDDTRVIGTVAVAEGQLFRIGRTWLRIQPGE